MKPPYQPLTVSRITLDQFILEATAFDKLVVQCPEIDHFCSSSYWCIPAFTAFSSYPSPCILRFPSGYVPMALRQRSDGLLVLESLESVWGLSCPFISPEPETLVREFASVFKTSMRAPLALCVNGIKLDGRIFRTLVEAFGLTHHVISGRSVRSYRASLAGGADGFLSRRSAKFRSNLRRCIRLSQNAGLEFEILTEIKDLNDIEKSYVRILDIEARSWKGMQGTGLKEPEMEAFYRQMLAMLAPGRHIRLLIARNDGHDIGFVFGAIFHGSYRGLQLSYDASYGYLSVGNLMQWELIQFLCENKVESYDMGVEVPYKERWAEEVHDLAQLWCLERRF